MLFDMAVGGPSVEHRSYRHSLIASSWMCSDAIGFDEYGERHVCHVNADNVHLRSFFDLAFGSSGVDLTANVDTMLASDHGVGAHHPQSKVENTVVQRRGKCALGYGWNRR